MKKILFVLFATLGFVANAQLDTLHIMNRDRDPRYFYWDSNWADVHWTNAHNQGWGNAFLGTELHGTGDVFFKPIVARKCYINSSLPVIGVAGITYQNKNASVYDTVEEHREPEYFILYEATDTSFVMLDSGRYDHHPPRHIYHLQGYWGDNVAYTEGPDQLLNAFFEIKEIYFDKPYTVSDSFYVATTCNNSCELWNDNQFIHYQARYPTAILTLHAGLNPPRTPEYSYYKTRATLPRRFGNYGTIDSSNLEWRYANAGARHICLWPILDTTGMFRPDKPEVLVCDTVQGFRVLSQQGNTVSFAWSPDNATDVWQLSWGEEGIEPEEGTLVYATNNVKSVVGLQDSVVYSAFVRARCNDTLFSEWSAPLRFWKGMNDTTGVGLQPTNTVEQLTYIYPNPAENSVTVASSFSMSRVELFALDGTRLLSQPTQGIMTQIDLTPFPKGTYMLRITTPAGTAIKKLVRR